ncbi:MAG TPA: hypothetical protein VF727_16810 [Allosphingosinicella sp.]|jgi:hypothetical protein
MTQPWTAADQPGLADAGAQVAQLRQILALVEEIAGRPGSAGDTALDEGARIAAAYEAALPIDRRRFDRAAWAAIAGASTGASALVTLEERGAPVHPAADRLAEELRTRLRELGEILSA